MDSSIIQRLLIDRRFDELSADTAALLDAFLADHPEEQCAVPELTRTLNLAEEALRPLDRPLASELPPLPRVITAPAPHPQRHWVKVSRPLSLAASLVLAFWAGGRLGTAAKPNADSSGQWLVRSESPIEPTGFWSLRRTLAAPPASREQPMTWSSPTTWPRIGEKL